MAAGQHSRPVLLLSHTSENQLVMSSSAHVMLLCCTISGLHKAMTPAAVAEAHNPEHNVKIERGYLKWDYKVSIPHSSDRSYLCNGPWMDVSCVTVLDLNF